MTVTIRPATEADVPRIAEISMAAFDPATDAVSRHLLPNAKDQDGTFGDDFRNWSVMRKSARMKAARSVMLVAVDGDDGDATQQEDNGQVIVGYALWFRPLAEGEQEEEPAKKHKAPVSGLDPDAAATLRAVMMQEERDTFGDKGARDVWSKQFHHFFCFYMIYLVVY